MEIYKCSECGTMVEEIKLGGCHPSCCGKGMTKLIPGTTDGTKEKHVPVVEVTERTVTVRVGAVPHPMAEAHYIEWIALETSEGVCRKPLKPGMEPKACFLLREGESVLSVYAYCNLHGLWKV